MVIFMDTSALIALADDQDKFHNEAKQQWRAILENQDALICNNYAVLETISLFQRRFGMEYIHALQTEILSLLELHWIDESQHQGALEQFLQNNRRDLSLVDCSSFSTMRHLGLKTVFTFDNHFREQGFNVIP
jgi:predicted nucleic acid-binding protein